MKTNAKEKAYSYIKNCILSNPYEPTNLSEAAIAEAIGVSRTPIREAFNQLATEGLIEIIPNKGAVPVRLGFEDIMMITQILEGLEGIAARIACQKIPRKDLLALKEEFMAELPLDTEEKRNASKLTGYKLHDMVSQSTGNSRMIAIIDNMLLQRRTIGHLGEYSQENAQKRFDQHVAIIDALLSGDPDAAEKAMRSHVLDVSLGAATALVSKYLY